MIRLSNYDLPGDVIEKIFLKNSLEDQKSLSFVSKKFQIYSYPNERFLFRSIIIDFNEKVEKKTSMVALARNVQRLFNQAPVEVFARLNLKDYLSHSILKRFIHREVNIAWQNRFKTMVDVRNFLSIPWGLKFRNENFFAFISALMRRGPLKTLEILEDLSEYQAQTLSLALEVLKIEALIIGNDVKLSPMSFEYIICGARDSNTLKRLKMTPVLTDLDAVARMSKAFAAAKSLESLRFESFEASILMCDRFFSTLSRPSSLKELILLDLDINQLEALVAAFGRLKLESLKLLKTHIFSIYVDKLSEGISNNKTLKTLDFSTCQLSEEDIKKLHSVCYKSETIKEFRLPSNLHLMI